MLITLSFKKSLIVEEFQGNYLKQQSFRARPWMVTYKFSSFFNLVEKNLLMVSVKKFLNVAKLASTVYETDNCNGDWELRTCNLKPNHSYIENCGERTIKVSDDSSTTFRSKGYNHDCLHLHGEKKTEKRNNVLLFRTVCLN